MDPTQDQTIPGYDDGGTGDYGVEQFNLGRYRWPDLFWWFR